MDSKLRCVFELPSENDKVVRDAFTPAHFPSTLLQLAASSFNQSFLRSGNAFFIDGQ